MNLREPKRKRRVKIKPQQPFPIMLGNGCEWRMYTAHLTDLGSCIIDPSEITSVHSMGFFGKGSLSRSYPSFGKPRYGAPPLLRNRQWLRKQEWLTQFKELSAEPKDSNLMDTEPDPDIEQSTEADNSPAEAQENVAENISEEGSKSMEEQGRENTSDIVEIPRNVNSSERSDENDISTEKRTEVDVVLDSPEEDDVRVIMSKDTEKNATVDVQQSSRNQEFCVFDDFNFKKNDTRFTDDDSNLRDKLLILPDSDSENEDYLKEIKPRIERESFPVQETLHLTFEETFFLLYGLGCLNLVNLDGNLLDINSAWLYFCKMDQNFIPKYVVYHYFRSKGWVVKPGLKYGGDFLLYKQGPPFYHASYIVMIDVLDADTLTRDPSRSMRSFTWNNLLGLERLSETASKEILFAQVLWPSSVLRNGTPTTVDVLAEFSVKELLWKRWNPKHNKEVIDFEEDDEESC